VGGDLMADYMFDGTLDAIAESGAIITNHYRFDGYVTAYAELPIDIRHHTRVYLSSTTVAIPNAEIVSSTEACAYIPAMSTGNPHTVTYIGGFDLYTFWEDAFQSLIFNDDYRPTPYFQALVDKLQAAIPELWDRFVWDQSSWDVGGIAYLPNQADADVSKWRQMDTSLTPFVC
jgi:hypothetical protein